MKNVWESYNFTDKAQKSAYDYLVEQGQDLIVATSGELRIEVEATDCTHIRETPRPTARYILYVIAKRLGGFRVKLLTVLEYGEIGRFPVDILDPFVDGKDAKNVSEADFVKAIQEIISRPIPKNKIQNLYSQSREHSKNRNISDNED